MAGDLYNLVIVISLTLRLNLYGKLFVMMGLAFLRETGDHSLNLTTEESD